MSAGQVVRRATTGDGPAIGQLLFDFNREFDEPTPVPGVLAERISSLIGGDEVDGDAGVADRTVVLLAGDAPPIGVAVLRFRPAIWSAGLECYLAELYVVPERRGQGAGRALLEHAVRLAREHGADTMDIGVDESDTVARRLYERLGFSNRSNADGDLMYVYERAL